MKGESLGVYEHFFKECNEVHRVFVKLAEVPGVARGI